ncbi:MAG: DUF3800 domain-containing protein [Armatimonadota bacterium]|nr:DUF3800 domain-containing protein [Armatimonadota bacterium]
MIGRETKHVTAHLLFVDESGQDHRESPYETLVGIVVEDRDLWNMVRAIQYAELSHFGTPYSAGRRELKGKKLLNRKVFRLASQLPDFGEEERRSLALRCLRNGETAGRREMTALAQAKLAYVRNVLDICAQHRCKAIGSIVLNPATWGLPEEMLRRDYCYLFERFFYFLEDVGPENMGIVVFDELEKSRSHLLLGQMDRYFKLSAKGRQRAGQVIPEPFFVHSDLTTGVQLADLAAYILSWGYRDTRKMRKPARSELAPFVSQVCGMRFRVSRAVGSEQKSKPVWSFVLIPALTADNTCPAGT